MSDEEYKAITILNDLLLERNKEKIEITTYDLFGNIEIVLKLIERQQKEIEALKEKQDYARLEKEQLLEDVKKKILY